MIYKKKISPKGRHSFRVIVRWHGTRLQYLAHDLRGSRTPPMLASGGHVSPSVNGVSERARQRHGDNRAAERAAPASPALFYAHSRLPCRFAERALPASARLGPLAEACWSEVCPQRPTDTAVYTLARPTPRCVLLRHLLVSWVIRQTSSEPQATDPDSFICEQACSVKGLDRSLAVGLLW